MTETFHLIQKRIGSKSAAAFLAAGTRRAYDIASQSLADLERMKALVEKYADLPMDLADGSLVLLAETPGRGDILKPFRNLLLR